MKILVLNDIHIGPPFAYRGFSQISEKMLSKIIKKLVKKHSPDLIINLGDLIRSQEVELDRKRYEAAIDSFIDYPVLHLVGNHELKKMTLKEIETIWKLKGFNQKSYGKRNIGPLTIIWLGLEMYDEKRYKLPKEQKEWLKKELEEIKKPTLIFSHCTIDKQNISGNFFYEKVAKHEDQGFFLEDHDDIQKIIARCTFVKAVLQAHLHHFYSKTIGNITYVTCPAMQNNIPEIYTLITMSEQNISIKAFSKNYCFAGTEINIHP